MYPPAEKSKPDAVLGMDLVSSLGRKVLRSTLSPARPIPHAPPNVPGSVSLRAAAPLGSGPCPSLPLKGVLSHDWAAPTPSTMH